jgi:hypothetical protein
MTIAIVQELLIHRDVRTTMVYTHVHNHSQRGIRRPVVGLARLPDERSAGAAYHARNGVTAKQPTETKGFARIICQHIRMRICGIQVVGRNFL